MRPAHFLDFYRGVKDAVLVKIQSGVKKAAMRRNNLHVGISWQHITGS